MQVNATDFKNFLDEYLEQAKDQPVIIHKTGKPVAVVLGVAEYEQLQTLRNRIGAGAHRVLANDD